MTQTPMRSNIPVMPVPPTMHVTAKPYKGMPSISSMAPSLATVMMTSLRVLVWKPASQYEK